MEHVTFEITGMSCGHCVKAVDKALQQTSGVTVETVAIGSATVAFDPAQTSAAQIAHAIDDAGYSVVATR
jgi:copper chaperone